MSKVQIEEIAKVLLTDCEGACTECEYYDRFDGSLCIPMRLANELYKQGYRKKSVGEWKGNGYLKHCSECGNVINFNNVSSWLYNYCPNCGAKMKGGE